MNTYQTEAIVLKRREIGEADRLYTLYSKEFGKIKAVAGGVRKINAKLAGHLEPYNLIWAELITKKNGDLIITTALSQRPILKANAGPSQTALFAKMADFSERMLREPQKDETMWNFILTGFLNASGIVAGETDKFLGDFKIGLIEIMGFGNDWEAARHYISDFDVI